MPGDVDGEKNFGAFIENNETKNARKYLLRTRAPLILQVTRDVIERVIIISGRRVHIVSNNDKYLGVNTIERFQTK